MSSSQFKIGSLCIPTPFFMDYWSGYWIVKTIHRDENLEMILITLYNLSDSREITVPMHDISSYFIVVSDKPKMWQLDG